MLTTLYKDPQAVVDYEVDWAAWLGSDTISTSTWSTSPTGLTTSSTSNTTTNATIWFSGGTVGTVYKVTNEITTAGGRTNDKSFQIAVQDN